MKELPRKRVLLAKRLIFAESSMHQARSLAEYALQVELRKKEAVFYPVMAGICVIYARSFLGSDGLGSLDERFGLFSDHDLQSTHDELLRCRHQFYAHRDLLKTKAKNPIDGEVLDMHAVFLRFDEHGNYGIRTHEPTYKDTNLPSIIKLCDFQGRRFNMEQEKAIDKLCKGRCPPAGEYELGRSFPF